MSDSLATIDKLLGEIVNFARDLKTKGGLQSGQALSAAAKVAFKLLGKLLFGNTLEIRDVNPRTDDDSATPPPPEKLDRERRKSMVATMNEEQMKRNIEDMPTSLIKAKGFRFATSAGRGDLVRSFYAALMNCGADVAKDIGLWFDR